jgi:predicted SnoaL-like aldol condensation-catalyzing enzyme
MTDTSNTTSSAKKLVVSAFAEFARGNTDIPRSVLAPHLIEHSPGNPSGRDAFIKHILNQPVADASLDLKRVIADGDLVALHYHLVPNGGGRGQAVVDIWRVEGDQIVEHWDVVQDVPKPSETPHGMF